MSLAGTSPLSPKLSPKQATNSFEKEIEQDIQKAIEERATLILSTDATHILKNVEIVPRKVEETKEREFKSSLALTSTTPELLELVAALDVDIRFIQIYVNSLFNTKGKELALKQGQKEVESLFAVLRKPGILKALALHADKQLLPRTFTAIVCYEANVQKSELLSPRQDRNAIAQALAVIPNLAVEAPFTHALLVIIRKEFLFNAVFLPCETQGDIGYTVMDYIAKASNSRVARAMIGEVVPLALWTLLVDSQYWWRSQNFFLKHIKKDKLSKLATDEIIQSTLQQMEKGGHATLLDLWRYYLRMQRDGITGIITKSKKAERIAQRYTALLTLLKFVCTKLKMQAAGLEEATSMNVGQLIAILEKGPRGMNVGRGHTCANILRGIAKLSPELQLAEIDQSFDLLLYQLKQQAILLCNYLVVNYPDLRPELIEKWNIDILEIANIRPPVLELKETKSNSSAAEFLARRESTDLSLASTVDHSVRLRCLEHYTRVVAQVVIPESENNLIYALAFVFLLPAIHDSKLFLNLVNIWYGREQKAEDAEELRDFLLKNYHGEPEFCQVQNAKLQSLVTVFKERLRETKELNEIKAASILLERNISIYENGESEKLIEQQGSHPQALYLVQLTAPKVGSNYHFLIDPKTVRWFAYQQFSLTELKRSSPLPGQNPSQREVKRPEESRAVVKFEPRNLIVTLAKKPRETTELMQNHFEVVKKAITACDAEMVQMLMGPEIFQELNKWWQRIVLNLDVWYQEEHLLEFWEKLTQILEARLLAYEVIQRHQRGIDAYEEKFLAGEYGQRKQIHQTKVAVEKRKLEIKQEKEQLLQEQRALEQKWEAEQKASQGQETKQDRESRYAIAMAAISQQLEKLNQKASSVVLSDLDKNAVQAINHFDVARKAHDAAVLAESKVSSDYLKAIDLVVVFEEKTSKVTARYFLEQCVERSKVELKKEVTLHREEVLAVCDRTEAEILLEMKKLHEQFQQRMLQETQIICEVWEHFLDQEQINRRFYKPHIEQHKNFLINEFEKFFRNDPDWLKFKQKQLSLSKLIEALNKKCVKLREQYRKHQTTRITHEQKDFDVVRTKEVFKKAAINWFSENATSLLRMDPRLTRFEKNSASLVDEIFQRTEQGNLAFCEDKEENTLLHHAMREYLQVRVQIYQQSKISKDQNPVLKQQLKALLEIIKILQENGASPYRLNKRNESAYDFANQLLDEPRLRGSLDEEAIDSLKLESDWDLILISWETVGVYCVAAEKYVEVFKKHSQEGRNSWSNQVLRLMMEYMCLNKESIRKSLQLQEVEHPKEMSRALQPYYNFEFSNAVLIRKMEHLIRTMESNRSFFVFYSLINELKKVTAELKTKLRIRSLLLNTPEVEVEKERAETIAKRTVQLLTQEAKESKERAERAEQEVKQEREEKEKALRLADDQTAFAREQAGIAERERQARLTAEEEKKKSDEATAQLFAALRAKGIDPQELLSSSRISVGSIPQAQAAPHGAGTPLAQSPSSPRAIGAGRHGLLTAAAPTVAALSLEGAVAAGILNANAARPAGDKPEAETSHGVESKRRDSAAEFRQ